MSLWPFGIQVLHSHLLCLKPRPHPLLNGALVDWPEPARPDEVARREVPGCVFELLEGEHVEVRSGKRQGEILWGEGEGRGSH